MRTEQTYRGWIARFFYFHKPNDVHDLAGKEVKQYLVLKRNVSVPPKKQESDALAFLFNQVWKKPLDDLARLYRFKTPA